MDRKVAFSRERERFLRESFPKEYLKLKATRQLTEICDAAGAEAAELWQTLEGQMRTNPQAPTETTARMEYFQAIPLMADEIVRADVIHIPPGA
jgi:hypothetical protein